MTPYDWNRNGVRDSYDSYVDYRATHSESSTSCDSSSLSGYGADDGGDYSVSTHSSGYGGHSVKQSSDSVDDVFTGEIELETDAEINAQNIVKETENKKRKISGVTIFFIFVAIFDIAFFAVLVYYVGVGAIYLILIIFAIIVIRQIYKNY